MPEPADLHTMSGSRQQPSDLQLRETRTIPGTRAPSRPRRSSALTLTFINPRPLLGLLSAQDNPPGTGSSGNTEVTASSAPFCNEGEQSGPSAALRAATVQDGGARPAPHTPCRELRAGAHDSLQPRWAACPPGPALTSPARRGRARATAAATRTDSIFTGSLCKVPLQPQPPD
jgi:hypothetical protein